MFGSSGLPLAAPIAKLRFSYASSAARRSQGGGCQVPGVLRRAWDTDAPSLQMPCALRAQTAPRLAGAPRESCRARC
eukprot:3945-Pyramimonas_sp.AAC.1